MRNCIHISGQALLRRKDHFRFAKAKRVERTACSFIIMSYDKRCRDCGHVNAPYSVYDATVHHEGLRRGRESQRPGRFEASKIAASGDDAELQTYTGMEQYSTA